MRIKQGDWLFGAPFAHRGLHQENGVPENSMAAFELALDKGYGIELDVQLSNDGQVVVFHDYTLERLSNGAGKVKETSLQALQQLRLLGTEETIPSLAQVLEQIAGKVPLLVELKGLQGGATQLEPAVAKLLDIYQGEFALMAFNPHRLAWFKKHRPIFLRGQLTERYLEDELPLWRKLAYKYCLYNGFSQPDFISYEIDMLPNWRMRGFARRGLPMISWTINSPERLKLARQYVDNIIFERIEPF